MSWAPRGPKCFHPDWSRTLTGLCGGTAKFMLASAAGAQSVHCRHLHHVWALFPPPLIPQAPLGPLAALSQPSVPPKNCGIS